MAVLLLVCLLAGCSDEGKDSPAGDEPSESDGPRTSSGGAAGNKTVWTADKSPAWPVGESWSWRLTSGALVDDLTATTVVLAASSSYQVGIEDGDDMQAYPFHLIPMGTVDSMDLAWQAHGLPVKLLRFPLTDGDTFTSDFWSAPGATVTITSTNVSGPRGSEPGFHSEVTYAGGGVFLEADYATERGQFVRIASRFGGDAAFAEAILLGNGGITNGTGVAVTDLVRFTAAGDDPASLQPRNFDVPDGANMLLMACFGSAPNGIYRAGYQSMNAGASCQGSQATGTEYQYAIQPNPSAGQAVASASPVGMASVTLEIFAVDYT